MSIVQVNSKRECQSYSSTESQSFRLGVRIFSRSALVGVREGGKIFNRGPKPLSAAPIISEFRTKYNIVAKYNVQTGHIYVRDVRTNYAGRIMLRFNAPSVPQKSSGLKVP